jgi:hypothetical protein
MKAYIFSDVEFVLGSERKSAKCTVLADNREQAKEGIKEAIVKRWKNLLGTPTDFSFGWSSSNMIKKPTLIDYMEN